jgi:acetyl esterase/lipase
MPMQRITDWDDAYANAAHTPGADDIILRWEVDANAFRERAHCELDVAYGEGAREKYDLFYPAGESKGLFVFVHGGYWLRFDKSFWSHFAAGALARGYAVCMPSYPLCPDVEIGDIGRCVAKAIAQVSGQVGGPIYLCGHSAGGHIASMLSTSTMGLSDQIASRIEKTISISGVHDLRPLLNTELNDRLKLTESTCQTWSPALLRPQANTKLLCWVGVDERPEFVRQNRLLADMWLGLEARVQCVEEAGRHHFDVIDGLRDPDSTLMRAVFED